MGELPVDRAGRRAVPAPRRRAPRAAHATQARHARRLRRRAVRRDVRARRRRVRSRDPDRAARRRLPRRHLVGRRRQALRVPQHRAERGRAVGRRPDRRDPSRGRRAPQPHARQLAAVAARRQDAAGQARPSRPGPAAGRDRARHRPEHPGDRRAERREQHLRDARHAVEQARRGAVRLLRGEPARDRRRDDRHGHADQQARRLHLRRRLARRRSHPRPHAREAVLVRHDLRALRPRHRRVGSWRPGHAHREAAARRARADPRRDHRPARLRVAADRAGDADVGGGARQRRLERHGPAARQGDGAGGAVPGRARRGAPHRAAVRGLPLDRAQRSRVAARLRREPSLVAHVHRQRRRSEAEAGHAVGPVERRALRRPGLADVPRAAEAACRSCSSTATRSS